MTIYEQISNYHKKNSHEVIGLMSGMSMDGVDLAHIKITGAFPNLTIELVGSSFKSYTKDLRKLLLSARDGHVSEIAKADILVAESFSQSVIEYLQSNNLNINEIDAIGSHGQVIYYDNAEKGHYKTVQVGSGSFIAERTNKLTVFNFRMRDIALGGMGAPLTPILDYILYGKSEIPIALNNLGSISNVTVVTKNIDELMGSDLGPANMPIDFFASRISSGPGYDKNGDLSSKGKVIQNILEEMMAVPFLKQPFPKAASYADFGYSFLENILGKHKECNEFDLLRTAVEFSAKSTADAYHNIIKPQHPKLKKILFSGGGIYNKSLMNRLKELLPEFEVESVADKDASFADAKEAILVAVLAHQNLIGGFGSISKITGASKDSLLGEIAPAPY